MAAVRSARRPRLVAERVAELEEPSDRRENLDDGGDVLVERPSELLYRLRELIVRSDSPIVDRHEELALLLVRENHRCGCSDSFEPVADGAAAFQVCDLVEQEVAGRPADLDGVCAGQGNPDAVDPGLHGP